MTEFNLTKVKIPLEHSVLSEMAADIAVNGKGQLMVMHHQPFSFTVAHVEYDPASGNIHFIGEDGTAQNFGMAAPPAARERLALVKEAALVLVDPVEEKVAGFKQVPVVTADQTAAKTVH